MNGKSLNLVVSQSHKAIVSAGLLYMLEFLRSKIQCQKMNGYPSKIRGNSERTNLSSFIVFYRLPADGVAQIKGVSSHLMSGLKACVFPIQDMGNPVFIKLTTNSSDPGYPLSLDTSPSVISPYVMVNIQMKQ